MRTHRPPAALATRGNVAGQAARILRAVVPVVTTGLHCGKVQPLKEESTPTEVVPVVTTGLHCGPYFGGKRRAAPLVVPVVTTGLHCGKAAARSVRSARLRSSPSSRRGSIAATVAGRSLGRRRRSSPSSRRGSIAARSSPRCSALVARVVPVVTTGLHCGVLSSPSMRAVRACRPRRHDGAPLRPRPAPRPARQTTWSSPSSRRGSIAARCSPMRRPVKVLSSPSSRRGSIAA